MDALLLSAAELAAPDTFGAREGSLSIWSGAAPIPERENEDALMLLPLEPEGLLVAVADGVGGARDGAFAARRVLEEVIGAARDSADEQSARPAILDGIESANRQLLERGRGATTIALAEIRRGAVRTYHVGDSEIWLVGGGGTIRSQTTSHSPTGYGLESGLLEEKEALQHEERHLVSNAVGARDMSVSVGSFQKLRPRDTLLLGTDGLFDNLHSDEIVETIRKGPLPQAAAALTLAAQERMNAEGSVDTAQLSKPDDLSFILFRPGDLSR